MRRRSIGHQDMITVEKQIKLLEDELEKRGGPTDDELERYRRKLENEQASNASQLKVLVTLGFEGTATISKLAEALSVSHPTVSHLVERLVQAGLVARVDPVPR